MYIQNRYPIHLRQLWLLKSSRHRAHICQAEAMQNDMCDSQEKCFHIKTNLLAPDNLSSVPPTQHRSCYISSAVATLLDRRSLLDCMPNMAWLLGSPAQVLVAVGPDLSATLHTEVSPWHTDWIGPGWSQELGTALWPRGLHVPSSTRCWHFQAVSTLASNANQWEQICWLKQLMSSRCHR